MSSTRKPSPLAALLPLALLVAAMPGCALIASLADDAGEEPPAPDADPQAGSDMDTAGGDMSAPPDDMGLPQDCGEITCSSGELCLLYQARAPVCVDASAARSAMRLQQMGCLDLQLATSFYPPQLLGSHQGDLRLPLLAGAVAGGPLVAHRFVEPVAGGMARVAMVQHRPDGFVPVGEGGAALQGWSIDQKPFFAVSSMHPAGDGRLWLSGYEERSPRSTMEPNPAHPRFWVAQQTEGAEQPTLELPPELQPALDASLETCDPVGSEGQMPLFEIVDRSRLLVVGCFTSGGAQGQLGLYGADLPTTDGVAPQLSLVHAFSELTTISDMIVQKVVGGGWRVIVVGGRVGDPSLLRVEVVKLDADGRVVPDGGLTMDVSLERAAQDAGTTSGCNLEATPPHPFSPGEYSMTRARLLPDAADGLRLLLAPRGVWTSTRWTPMLIELGIEDKMLAITGAACPTSFEGRGGVVDMALDPEGAVVLLGAGEEGALTLAKVPSMELDQVVWEREMKLSDRVLRPQQILIAPGGDITVTGWSHERGLGEGMPTFGAWGVFAVRFDPQGRLVCRAPELD